MHTRQRIIFRIELLLRVPLYPSEQNDAVNFTISKTIFLLLDGSDESVLKI